MSNDLLEQPHIEIPILESTDDQERLKSNFNASLKAEIGEALEPKVVVAKVEVTKMEPKVELESFIPKELMGQLKEEKKVETEEPLVTEEERNAVKGGARANFDKLEKAAQTRIAAERAANEALRKELAEAKSGKPTDTEQLAKEAKEHRERADELQARLERAAYLQSPKYEKFGTEESAELKLAKGFLEGGEVNPAIIEAAAQTQGAHRMKIMRDAGMDSETIAAVSPYLARVDAIRRERDQSVDAWKTERTLDQSRLKTQQDQQEQAQRAQEKAVYDEVMSKAKAMPAFTRVDGNDKWNALVDQNYKEAEEFAQGRKPLAELFELGFNGVANRTTQLMNQELTKQLNEVRTELSRLKAAQPSVGKTGEAEAKKPTSETAKDQTEHYKNAFNAAKAEVAANGYSLM